MFFSNDLLDSSSTHSRRRREDEMADQKICVITGFRSGMGSALARRLTVIDAAINVPWTHERFKDWCDDFLV